jgi:hypothetical protein
MKKVDRENEKKNPKNALKLRKTALKRLIVQTGIKAGCTHLSATLHGC